MNELEQLNELLKDLPAPRPEAREAARAALVARFEATHTPPPRPRRFLRARNLALAGALAGIVAALLIVVGTGNGGSGVKPEVANAADLTDLAELAPHLEIAGGWQITNTEVSPDGGGTTFHYERDPTGTDATDDAEIRWHILSPEELGQRLEGEGFEAAGTVPTRITNPRAVWREGDFSDDAIKSGTAHAYVAGDEGDGFVQAVGVWREDGWTLELSARVEGLDMLERLLERVEVLGPEEWVIALRPGGAMWLRESLNGSVQKVEHLKHELPDGTVVNETRTIAKTPEQLEQLDFTAPFPVIYHEGDNVRVEVEQVPSDSEAP